MPDWICTLRLNEWENPVLEGEREPPAGERVLLRVRNQQVFVLPERAGVEAGDVLYLWPRNSRREAAELAWRHLERRMRQARVTHRYPCCGGPAIFFPTWLSLALNDYITLAEERVCPACHRHWEIEATVVDNKVDEVIWLHRSARRKSAAMGK